jgi:hypothetical protein
MKQASRSLIAAVFGMLAFSGVANAMDSAGYGEFQLLLQSPLPDLTTKAEALMARKYEATAATKNDPPEFDFQNRTINIAYQIAVKKPKLIAGHLCYDPACENLHLANLAECFFTGGQVGDYSLLAVSIEACSREAILIFLWSELGAGPGEIDGALRFLFDPSVHEGPAITP